MVDGRHQDEPISVFDANIPRHLPGTWKAVTATPQAKAKSDRDASLSLWEIGCIRPEAYPRSKRNYSREQKMEVLIFLMHHWVPKFDDEDDRVLRRASASQTSPG
ncbi:hypothetical protein EV426DRAFT_572100 [Tirmania nivea]|nr:hypothetical protein EV426DRAFT_572100 [Tirmania nivea]